MRHPVLARSDEAGDRFYTWNDETFWSVTTLIGGGVPKYGLAPWYAKVVAELVAGDIADRGPHARAHAAIRRWARLGRQDVVDRQALGQLTSIKLDRMTIAELAIRWLKGEAVRLRDRAGEVGVDVHDEAERVVLDLALDTSDAYAGGITLPAWPAHLAGYEAGFVNFLEDWRPVYLATEATVFNRREAYAGTLDAIVRIEVAPEIFMVAVLDYKSGREVHPEVGMQLSAYARGDFIGGPDRVSELELPAVGGGLVLHLLPKPTPKSPRGYALRKVRITDDVFEAFLFAREIYRWSKRTSKTIVEPAVVPWRREVATR